MYTFKIIPEPWCCGLIRGKGAPPWCGSLGERIKGWAAAPTLAAYAAAAAWSMGAVAADTVGGVAAVNWRRVSKPAKEK